LGDDIGRKAGFVDLHISLEGYFAVFAFQAVSLVVA